MARAGRICVNGAPCLDAAMQVSPGDAVAVDGVTLDTRLSYYLMLNKPKGVLTAARDAKQKTVMDLLPPRFSTLGCMPVGRLDKDTTGLLIFTTDGTLSHRLLSPKNNVGKVYRAEITGELTESDAVRFKSGIPLEDFTCLPADLHILYARPEASAALATVREGKFHQVKRMFGALGHEVTALHRLSFGGVSLDEGLAPGAYRELTTQELDTLKGACGHAE